MLDVEQAQVLGFADRQSGVGEDADDADVEEGENARRRQRRDVAQQAADIVCACAAGIDGGGHTRAARDEVRIDAQERATPIDMGVEVDQSGNDIAARHVAGFRRMGVADRGGDRGDLAAAEGDIHGGVDSLRGIDHMPALQDQIVARHGSGSGVQAAARSSA